MNAVSLLAKIQPTWIQRASRKVRIVDGRVNDKQTQLEVLFDALLNTTRNNDPAILRNCINDWLGLSKVSVLGDNELTLVETLVILQSIIFEAAEEELGYEEIVQLLNTSIPIFSEAIEYASRLELNHHVELATKELGQAHLSIERIEKNKSDFISIAAHELKTPLTLIEGYTSMLEDQLDELKSFNQVALLLRGIDKGIVRLREIVSDMIDASRIDNEMLALNFQPVWINRLFPLIEQEFSTQVNSRKQNLELYPFPRQQKTFADEERLFQALCNIVSNAIKFTPDGGTITVDGKLLPGFIEITIKDTGIGIDPKNHKKIFEKFSNLGEASLHSSGKIKFMGGGPGLGLPITKGIIDAHGGAIWVESDGYDEEICPGTTFHLLIPLRDHPPDEEIARLFDAFKTTNNFRNYESVNGSDSYENSENNN